MAGPLRLVGAGALSAVVQLARRWQLAWGASARELALPLPGDELIDAADLTATRAVTIEAAPGRVWPWLAQLGQERAGFYSYEWLENLAGLDIRNADHIVPSWQSLSVGDELCMAPLVALEAVLVEPGRALVVAGRLPIGPAPYRFTWAFALQRSGRRRTRLVVRERYRYTRWWAPLVVEPVEAVSFLMTRRMLLGIKKRCEATRPNPAAASAARRPARLRARTPAAGLRAPRAAPATSPS